MSNAKQRKLVMVADFDDDGEVVDVTLYHDDTGDEPFGISEYLDGSYTRDLFESAWDYFADRFPPVGGDE